MKNKNLRQLSLILIILLSVMLTSNQIFAQNNEDDDENENASDMNSNRFESGLDNSYETQKPFYQKEIKNKQGNDVDNHNNSELDIDVHRGTYSAPVIISGGNGPVDNGNTQGRTSTSNGFSQPITRVDPNTSFPDNPPDPDAPIDGGISLLVAAGLGFGMYKRNKDKS